MLGLYILHPDCLTDPYPLDYPDALADAIASEAAIVGADPAAAAAALAAERRYVDPVGVHWVVLPIPDPPATRWRPARGLGA